MKHFLLFTTYYLLLIILPSPVFGQSMTEGFKLRRMEGERVRWEVRSDVAYFKENLKTLEGIELRFYPKNKDSFTVEAVEGWLKENDKDEIFLNKNVRVKGYLKADVKCENLLWDSASEVMHTSDRVEIEGGKWHIRGEGLEFSPEGDVITIEKNVTMEIQSYEKF